MSKWQSLTLDDKALTKSRVTTFIELASKRKGSGQPDFDSLRDHLDEALQRIKDHFDLRKEMAEHAARDEEGTAALQEKLKNIDMRLLERDRQNAADETAKEQLRDQIHRLQAQIESLQQSHLSTVASDTHFIRVRDELEAKGRALDAANDKLLNIQQELHALRETNNSLHARKQSLLSDVAAAERRVATADAEKHSVEIKYKDDAEQLRTDLSNHLQNALSKNKMQSENSLRNLTSQRDEATQKIKHLQGEVEAARASLVQFQQESTERTAEQASHLRAMEDQAKTSQHEIESLRTRLAEQHDQTEDDDATEQHISKLSELSDQLNFARTERRAALEQKGVLAAKVESIQNDLMQMQCAKEEAEKRALQLSGERSSQLEQLQNRVSELENDLEQARTDLQNQKKGSEERLASEKSSREGSLKALQINIQEKQVDIESYKEKLLQAEAELEKALTGDRNHPSRMIPHCNAEDLESQVITSEIMADHQYPHPETTQPKQPLSHASGLPQSPSFRPPFGVGNVKDGITPTATDKENQPPRPRKKVDRSTNTITDADPLPVPDILRRPDSRVSESQKTEVTRHEPVADPGQPRSSQTGSLLGSKARSSDTHGERPITAAISESDEMLDRTQTTEKLPWFSEFNDNNALSQDPRAEAKSPAVTNSPVNDTGLLANVLSDLHSPRTSRGQIANDPATTQSEGFAIYEDLQQGDRNRKEKSAESRGALRDSLPWTRAQADKEEFRKVYPNPNSALKLVRHDDDGKRGPESAGLEPKSRMQVSERSTSKLSKTQARMESAVYHPKSQRIPTASSAKSSSPDYVVKAGARMQTTYHLESGPDSTKLGTFRNQSKALLDPRLVGREAQQAKKRKISGSVLEGYESERKKRKTQEPAATPTRYQRRSSRRTVAQESSARNATPLPDTYSYKDTAALNKTSRKRAPAPNPTERRRRGSKKSKPIFYPAQDFFLEQDR